MLAVGCYTDVQIVNRELINIKQIVRREFSAGPRVEGDVAIHDHLATDVVDALQSHMLVTVA